jgi:xanthine dehydrogenase YagR molybdenum-binding subunit
MSATPRIGDPLPRIDGVAKVTGAAHYAAEHFPPDLLYGWIVSAAIARGQITDIDDTAARAVPGVVEIISHHNRLHLPWFDRSYKDGSAVSGSPFRPLYDDSIMFSGQPVLLVVADTLEGARDAASLVKLSYLKASHNTDLSKALADKFVPKSLKGVFQLPRNRGDAGKALERSPVRHSAIYHLATHHHNPIEMHGATVVWEGDGKITVYDKTQGAQNVQSYLAEVFGYRSDEVRVMNPYVGGAFGSGLRPQYHVFLATMAAKMLKRSVRVTMTRQQMFTHVHRPAAIQSVALGANADGKLNAIINNATTSTSRFENYMETVCNWGLMNYACENASGEYTLAPVDTYTPGDMRAPGAATGMTLFEIAMDELAHSAAVDPLELRLINYSDRDAIYDRPFTSKALREALALGATRFGWAGRQRTPRSMRDGAELVGWGMATGVWDALFEKTAARARLDTQGRLEVASATADIGTGTYTMMAQVAGETLGIPLERISVKLGDSDLPEAPVEGGSWGAASTGAAVQRACAAIGDELYKAAKKVAGNPIGEVTRDEVAFRDDHLIVSANPALRLPVIDLIRATGKHVLEAQEVAKPGVAGLVKLVRKAKNTHSAVFVEVKVDEELYVVRVTRVVIAVAAGRIINPVTARSQVVGAVVMGIGMALHEETALDHHLGRFITHNLADYHIPVNADIPDIEVIFVDERDPEVSPLGVKGVGEIGIVGTAAAVANAIFHATGKRVRSLPVTVDKLLDQAEP